MPNITYQAAANGSQGRLTRLDAGRYLGVSSKTLCEWRRMGKGPASHKIGGMCFYYTDDLKAYVRERSGRGD